jgi:5-hydroxyisourate hydrolase-like protein (transthyretin family)
VRLTGTAGPLPALAGAKVAIKVQRKVGRKWVKMRTATKAVNSSTGKFSWSYRAMKKGQYRVTASIAKKANVYTAKKLVRSFRVK